MIIRLHREGRTIILVTALICFSIGVAAFFCLPWQGAALISVLLLLVLAFTMRFFRVPARVIHEEDGVVYAPADGTIVVIEPTEEKEYFGDKRIQISVFMSVWNIHINWFPVGGKVDYFKYHPGRYMVAWHPKSSDCNERTTTVVDTGKEKILFRQIAGMVARRIVSYAKVGESVGQSSECGFIKFGSRVDVFLPVDAEVQVKIDQKVTGTQTVIAKLKR